MDSFIVFCTRSNVELLILFIMREGDFVLNFFSACFKSRGSLIDLLSEIVWQRYQWPEELKDPWLTSVLQTAHH